MVYTIMHNIYIHKSLVIFKYILSLSCMSSLHLVEPTQQLFKHLSPSVVVQVQGLKKREKKEGLKKEEISGKTLTKF